MYIELNPSTQPKYSKNPKLTHPKSLPREFSNANPLINFFMPIKEHQTCTTNCTESMVPNPLTPWRMKVMSTSQTSMTAEYHLWP
jgi:hypothetical protein